MHGSPSHPFLEEKKKKKKRKVGRKAGRRKKEGEGQEQGGITILDRDHGDCLHPVCDFMHTAHCPVSAILHIHGHLVPTVKTRYCPSGLTACMLCAC